MDERIEDELRCGICQNIYKVPVFVDLEHSCFNKKNFCMGCAYFCFELHKENRKRRYKCPFCNSGNYEINKDNIEVDDAMMLTINNLIISEKIGKLECNCGKVFGDGYEMLEHLEEECDEFFWECKLCKMITLRKEEHKCPMDECPECNCSLKDKNKDEKIKHFMDCEKDSTTELLKITEEFENKALEFDILRQALITLHEDIQIKKIKKNELINQTERIKNLIKVLADKK